MADIHPMGVFIAEVLDHGFRESKEKKTLSLQIQFQTEHGTVYADLYFTEKTVEKTTEKLRAIGWEGEDFYELRDGQVLRGKRCQITVKHEVYEGSTRAKVEWINDENYVPGLQHDDEAAVKAKMFNAVAKRIKRTEPAMPF